MRVRMARLHRWHCGLGTVAYHWMCLTSSPHTALSSPLLIPAPLDQYYYLKGINWKCSSPTLCVCVCVIKYYCAALTKYSWLLCIVDWFSNVSTRSCGDRLPVEHQYLCGVTKILCIHADLSALPITSTGNSRWPGKLRWQVSKMQNKITKSKRKHPRRAAVPLNCALLSVCYHRTSTRRSVSAWSACGSSVAKKWTPQEEKRTTKRRGRAEREHFKVEKMVRKVLLNDLKFQISSHLKEVVWCLKDKKKCKNVAMPCRKAGDAFAWK